MSIGVAERANFRALPPQPKEHSMHRLSSLKSRGFAAVLTVAIFVGSPCAVAAADAFRIT
jgi:hypothetical protein